MSQKIRIRLKAYDHKLLDQSAVEIIETASYWGTHRRTGSAADAHQSLHCSSRDLTSTRRAASSLRFVRTSASSTSSSLRRRR